MTAEIEQVEPVEAFIAKVGKRLSHSRVEVHLDDAGPLLSGRVVVDKTLLDLFATRLYHESPGLYRAFLESFPTADAGKFVG